MRHSEKRRLGPAPAPLPTRWSSAFEILKRRQQDEQLADEAVRDRRHGATPEVPVTAPSSEE